MIFLRDKKRNDSHSWPEFEKKMKEKKPWKDVGNDTIRTYTSLTLVRAVNNWATTPEVCKEPKSSAFSSPKETWLQLSEKI